MEYNIGLRGTGNYWVIIAKTAKEARTTLKDKLGISGEGYFVTYRKRPSGLPIDYIK